jgi:hypothetical protein
VLAEEQLEQLDDRLERDVGSIVMRLAQHPWGPWSAATEHLMAGSPDKVGDAYGPGGLMFHSDCMDVESAACVRSDPYTLQLTGQCAMRASSDLGRLYAPGIIDAYTRKNAQGGLDITWTVSTWNPYATYLMGLRSILSEQQRERGVCVSLSSCERHAHSTPCSDTPYCVSQPRARLCYARARSWIGLACQAWPPDRACCQRSPLRAHSSAS